MPSGIVVREEGKPGEIGQLLLSPVYMKKLPDCYRDGKYFYMEKTGTVRCILHGTVDQPIPD